MDYKKIYGLVETPRDFVGRMLDLIDESVFGDTDTRWLDAGAGRGVFSECICERIGARIGARTRTREQLKNGEGAGLGAEVDADPGPTAPPTQPTQSTHFPGSRRIDLVEVNEEFREDLCARFQNVFTEDFLNFDRGKYDVIVGNPPYNRNGSKKVPTNTSQSKKEDGQTMWINFLYKSLELLNPGGTLCYIVPSIWMKNNHIVYKELIKYQLDYIIPFTSTESNKIFSGDCQTPTCVLVLRKTPGDGVVNIYDKISRRFVAYDSKFTRHLPLVGINVVSAMYDLCDTYGSIAKYVKKTNVVSRKIGLAKEPSRSYRYKNVDTCLLKKTAPYLKLGYSNNPCPFFGEKKIILSHKMYGFPYMDASGEYGISKRDNYVVTGLASDEEYERVFDFLSSNLVFFLMETTRYRMRYLERYVFDFIPDILNLNMPAETGGGMNGMNGMNGFGRADVMALMAHGNGGLDMDATAAFEGRFDKYFVSKYDRFDFDVAPESESDLNNKIETPTEGVMVAK